MDRPRTLFVVTDYPQLAATVGRPLFKGDLLVWEMP